MYRLGFSKREISMCIRIANSRHRAGENLHKSQLRILTGLCRKIAGKHFVDTVEPMEVSVSRGKIASQCIVQPALFDFVLLSHSFSRFLEICPAIMGHSRSRKRRSLGFRDFEIDSIGMECAISKLWSK